MTAAPVTVFVFEGEVVVVCGGKVVLGGAVVDGAVVDLVGGPVVVVEDGWLGVEPAEVVVVEEPPVARDPDAVPMVKGADFVWKLSTPTSPATVAATTIVARFIEVFHFECKTYGPSGV